MSSLKSRMAAFRKASSKDTAPKKEKIVVPRAGKINMNFDPFAKKPAVVTPDGKAPPKKKVDIFANKQNEFQQTGKAENAGAVEPESAKNQDWEFLHELSIQFDNLKALEAEEVKNGPTRAFAVPEKHVQGDKTSIRASLEGTLGGNFTANGKFLTNEYIGKHLVESKKYKSLVFDYTAQNKLFTRFNRKDDERRKICSMFVDALAKHPKASQISALRVSESICIL